MSIKIYKFFLLVILLMGLVVGTSFYHVYLINKNTQALKVHQSIGIFCSHMNIVN